MNPVVPSDPAGLRAWIDEHLVLVEQRLTELAVGGNPFITEAANHLVAAGGKRFRPQLVLLAAQYGDLGPGTLGVGDQRLIDTACVMELTHVASLYHDDVMDEAELRRGAPSANARFGNSVAIMIGDLLFARASSTVAELGVDFVRLQAETFARLVQGQVNETVGPGAGDDPLQHHLQVIADKTGSLIAASALGGAMVSGADPQVCQALAAFGEQIGVVFQLSDDIIDIASDVTGKTPGTDLREGVPTLPTMLLRQTGRPEDAELLARIDGDLEDDQVLGQVLADLRVHPVMDQARQRVREHAELAREQLRLLPDGPATQALHQLCDELVERMH